MPRPASAPIEALTWNARAVPIPCEATPRAKPPTASCLTRMALNSSGETTAPVMPVAITSTAVSDGTPPSFCDTAIAIGVVADLGPALTAICTEPPNASTIPTAETTAVSEPASSAANIGRNQRRTRGNWRASGTASATVAGPSKKWTNCAPVK